MKCQMVKIWMVVRFVIFNHLNGLKNESTLFGTKKYSVSNSRSNSNFCGYFDMLIPQERLELLKEVQPLYISPKEPLVEEVLIPGFQNATSVDCMVGYFTSEVFVNLAPGLATFINQTENCLRLIISPLLSSKDLLAIENSEKTVDDVTNELLENLFVTEQLLIQHTLKCFTWLLREKRIVIRIALMKDALFHPKVWMFHIFSDVMAVHGSSNSTVAGISKNIEQVAVSKSWEDANQSKITSKFCSMFDDLWNNRDNNCIVLSLPKALENRLLQTYGSTKPPTENDLRVIYRRVFGFERETSTTIDLSDVPVNRFKIPKELNFEAGPFKHQVQAVDAWCNANFQGILEMATGSGKTITAMICAYKLFLQCKNLLIVVSAPHIPLVHQWCEEIRLFGIIPINISKDVVGKVGRAKKINQIRRQYKRNENRVEVIVCSHNILVDANFNKELSKLNCTTLLIADEVHNLGSESFISNPPEFFDNKLGLSATPVRQYDEEGTKGLQEYFGIIIFKYTLEEAIGECLVEYEYYVHSVELTIEEMNLWFEITNEIKANAWRQDRIDSDKYIKNLFFNRRAILESAKNKIEALENVILNIGLENIQHTLIYTSEKSPDQLTEVNKVLKSKGIRFHQLTEKETKNRNETKNIIHRFQEGTLQVLTAKRVLDEGVNIPQIQKAFILASTTVERQWVQRRGRVLRKCSEINKSYSEIHDFIVLPPSKENLDSDARSIYKQELKRMREFAKLAMNAGRNDGPLQMLHEVAKATSL